MAQPGGKLPTPRKKSGEKKAKPIEVLIEEQRLKREKEKADEENAEDGRANSQQSSGSSFFQPDPEEEQAKKERQVQEVLTKDITDLFNSLDLIGNGYLTAADIQAAYSTFGIHQDIEDCQAIMEHFDTGNGYVTFYDFHREMREVMSQPTNDEHLKMVFDSFDRDG